MSAIASNKFQLQSLIKRCTLSVLLISTLFSSAAFKRDLPDWQRLLYKTYSLAFVDSHKAMLTLDSLYKDSKRLNKIDRIAHCEEIMGLITLFQNDAAGAQKLFNVSEFYFKSKNDFISLGDYELRKAIIVMNKLKFRESEKLFLKALWYFEHSKVKEYQISIYYKMGQMMMFENKAGDAVGMYTKGLKIAEALGDKQLILEGNLNLGSVMMNISVDEKTGKYLLKALQLATELGDSAMLTNTAFYLSSYYDERNEKWEALKYARQAISLFKNKKEHSFYGTLSELMAGFLVETPKLDSALYFANIALDKFEKEQNKTGILAAKNIRAKIFYKQGDFAGAKKEYESCLPLILELGFTATAAAVYKGYAETEFKLGNSDKAYKHLSKYIAINDSIFKQESQREIAQVEASFQNEKKEMQIQSLNRDKALKDVELSSQNKQIELQNKQKIGMAIGLLLALVFSFFIWKSYKQKQKDNLVIKRQRDQMETQKTLVEAKNREITDSINYAKRLQDAILPPADQIKSVFKEAFILYQPKEIVAGDFYWMDEHKGKVFFAVCDCTGHGVPGAMVSLVGHNALNRCVKEFDLTEPGTILDKLSELVEETFSKSDNDVKDGMDISLCVYDTNKKSLKWSGANNPIWLVRKGELVEIKGDKQPIGKYDNKRPFSNHEIEVAHEDCIYLFSDGYADQFGGAKGKKFKYAQLKQLIDSIGNKTMEDQLHKLSHTFDDWKGNLDQVDDVCVIGIRV